MNKYKTYYNNIVENARRQNRTCRTETHHIVPRSLGGSDTADNLVKLTAREHFVCHWLLTKFTTGQNRYKMIKALSFMRTVNKYHERYDTKITARVYEKLRTEHAKVISKQNKGRIQPQHEKEKQIKAMTGRKRAPFTKEWKEKLSKASSGKNNSRYGVTLSEETKRKMSERARGRKAKRVVCEHCQRDLAVNIYKQFHGDKCHENKRNHITQTTPTA